MTENDDKVPERESVKSTRTDLLRFSDVIPQNRCQELEVENNTVKACPERKKAVPPVIFFQQIASGSAGHQLGSVDQSPLHSRAKSR